MEWTAEMDSNAQCLCAGGHGGARRHTLCRIPPARNLAIGKGLRVFITFGKSMHVSQK
jgi:hypothetical protein